MKKENVLIFALVVGLVVSYMLFWYFYVQNNVEGKCYFEICDSTKGPEVCFALQLRNVTSGLERPDCVVLKEKCELKGWDSTHYFFEECIWNGDTCTCKLPA